MSKKQDFIRSEQSRDKHPERDQVGSASRETMAAQGEVPDADKQQAHSGKVANDHNKMGEQAPTQRNEGRRTPESRNDRLNLAGGPQDKGSTRKGPGGPGTTPRGAG